MPDYLVRFNIHLVPSTKPDGWPNPLFHDLPLRVENYDALRALINKEVLTIVRQGGVVVLKDSNKVVQEVRQMLDLRRYIPLHMVSFIETETKLLEKDVEDGDMEGIQLQ